ncbi:MAG: IclR family transcriptional regulator [Nitratireductor sp.]|uniref:IclR family transcriptional regulator n=1 Tax=Parvibaculum sp. TaxID=2024848 RepID=UPI00326C9B69
MPQNRIPAVERATLILTRLAQEPRSTIRELSAALNLPRSTTYRILNSLEPAALVHRIDETRYELGPGLKRLARHVVAPLDPGETALPLMEAFAEKTGYNIKLSVIDETEAKVVAVAEGNNPYAMSTRVGRRFPLHAGAASKVLLAYASPELRAAVLSGPMERLTPATVTDPADLASSLQDIIADGIGFDRGEHALGIHAIAVPVFDETGACAAALSIPYLAAQEAEVRVRVSAELIACGKSLSRLLCGNSDGRQYEGI